jgi:hypothetical protein
VTSAGCAQIAGIDHTSSSGRNSDTVAIQRMSIGNTVVPATLDLSGLQATYLVEDPASASGFDMVTADTGKAPHNGTWHADLPDPATVIFTLPDVPTPIPRLFAFPDRALLVSFGVLEHPGRSPAPDGAMLTVTAPLDVGTLATDSFRAFTVGSWTSRTFAAAELPVLGATTLGPVSYAFSTASSLSGRPDLDRLTAQDAFLILRYSGTALTGVAEAPPFDQIGTDTVTTPTMTAVVADQMLDVKVAPAGLSMRYAGARPAVATLAMNWNVVAAPGYSVANNTGPVLQSGALLPTDVGVTVKYGNPFATRWNTMFTLATSESRVYMAMGPTGTPIPVTLFAGMDQFLDLSAAVAPLPGFELTLEAGLPVTISLGASPLLTDGQMIAKPTKFVEVTFETDKPTATLFNLFVFDLLPNMAATALEYHLVLVAASGEAKFELPPDIFQSGHSYTLRALCTSGGYPGIAAGDFQTRTLPLSQSFLDSAVFTVMP